MAAAVNVDSLFGMLPQEAAYETSNIQNILFNDTEDNKPNSKPKGKSQQRVNWKTLREKG